MRQALTSSDAVAPSRAVWRMRMAAVCLSLGALAFLQDPGLITIDTKVDLAVDPAGWLDRALHVWDPTGTFGQLQNQAYGYLWPMGPFFLLGKLLAIPAWVVQRLWWSALLIVAFTGVVKLAEKLGIGTGWSRILAGVAFALSPRLITELGPISVEAWPSAIAPWVLVPLIGLRHGVPLRRAVTLSALAVACAGGVNATAVLAVVPLAAIWLLGLHPIGLRVKALVAWGLAVACATAWWVVPLLMLGRFSPPFLDYIETAGVTTTPTDMVTVLRGASHWHAYLGGAFGPPWSAGWAVAVQKPLIVATLVVAGLGVLGLARRGLPHRWFLITGLLAGLALVGLGHLGAVAGLFAEQQQAFLDAAGAPLRNVHKFDVVLRLPLVLGLAHLVGLVLRTSWDVAGRWRAGLVSGVAVAAVAAVASPALAGGLAAPGSFRDVPGYWQQAATWLERNLGDEHVLVVPGARFPRYLWGSPSDEITQPLLDARWGVRSSIPLTPPATIRLMDTVESVLTTGRGSRGLADLLARSGVRYLLLRSDLDYGKSGATQPVIARQGLARSAGLTPVAGFGPWVGGGRLPGTVIDDGLDTSVRALEVWEVERDARPVVAYDASSLTTVVGGPESLLGAAAAGVLPAAPVVLAGDKPADLRAGEAVLTDGMRRREVAFGRAHDSASATMAAGETGRLGAPARDYLPGWGDEWDTTVRYRGIHSVAASSSFAQAAPLSGARPGFQPYAALDGDLTTSWRSAPGTVATDQWFEVRLPAARPIRRVQIAFDLGADSVPTRLTVVAGRNKPKSQDVSGSAARIDLPAGQPADRVLVKVEDVLDVRLGFGGVGIAELSIPGVKAERTLVVPPAPVTGPAAMVLSAAPSTPACTFDRGRPLCSGDLARTSEDGPVIDRTVTLPADARYRVGVLARPRPGAALDALLDAGGPAVATTGITPTVTASSIGVPEPAARPGAVVDGDPGTVWYAAGEDKHPWLRMRWPAKRWVSGLRLTLPPDAAAARVWQVTAMGDDDVRNGFVDEGGTFAFDSPMYTDEVTVLLADTVPARSYDPYRNVTRMLAPAVGEITALPDGPAVPADPDRPVALPCGSGPTVRVDGAKRSTALRATRRDLLELREVDATVCGVDATAPLAAKAGQTRVNVTPSAVATASQVAFVPVTAAARGGGQGAGVPEAATGLPVPMRVTEWGPTRRRVQLDAYPNQRVLALRENSNAGWEATAGGKKLQPVVLDGWQQGWVVPAGVRGEVELRFGPDRAYASALLAGAVLLLALIVVTLLPARRKTRYVPGSPHRLLTAVVGGLALLAVGGIAAAGIALVLIAVTVALRATVPHLGQDDRRRLRHRLWLAGRWLPAVLFAAAGWLAVTRGGHTAAAPQLLAVAAVVLLWLSVLLGGRRRRWASR